LSGRRKGTLLCILLVRCCRIEVHSGLEPRLISAHSYFGTSSSAGS
jgi:hypothetical protein